MCELFGNRVTLNFGLAIKVLTHFIDIIVIHDMTFLDETIGILELVLRLRVAFLRIGSIRLYGLIENDGLDPGNSFLLFPLKLHSIPYWTANPPIFSVQFIAISILDVILVLMLSGELFDDLLVLKPLQVLLFLWGGVVIGEIVEPSSLLCHVSEEMGNRF